MDNRRGIYRDNIPVLVSRDRKRETFDARLAAGRQRAERSQPSPGKPKSPFMPCLRLESRRVENGNSFNCA